MPQSISRDEAVAALESSEQRFRVIFDSSPIGMALHRMDGTYLDTNAAYNEMFGYFGEGFTLETVIERVLPEFRDVTRSSFEAIGSGSVNSATFEGGFISATGEVVYALVKLTVLPVTGSKPDMVVGQVIDVTELKETQRRVDEMVSTKSKFLAAVSHELRTPLTAVIGLAELLRDPDQHLNSEQRASLIDTIVDSGFDVSNLVEDLVTAARQEAGQLKVVAVPVNLLAQTRQALEVIRTDDEIVVAGDAPRAVGDPGRVRQILRNLISNAQRYGGDSIRVDLDTIDGFARATVSDDGPGVLPDSEELIFKSYEKGLSKESNPGSVGIGLSISRELARQMGGELKYSRVDGRTRFELTLPVAKES